MAHALDYTISSGLFAPPLDFILHNAGYAFVFQVRNAYNEDKEKLFSLPGLGKRRRQAIDYAMKQLKEST